MFKNNFIEITNLKVTTKKHCLCLHNKLKQERNTLTITQNSIRLIKSLQYCPPLQEINIGDEDWIFFHILFGLLILPRMKQSLHLFWKKNQYGSFNTFWFAMPKKKWLVRPPPTPLKNGQWLTVTSKIIFFFFIRDFFTIFLPSSMYSWSEMRLSRL